MDANDTGAILYPAIQPGFIYTLQALVTVTCVLSILGAGLIILTYVVFKDLRTTARQLLVNLSVADIFVAASHVVGLYVNFKRFLLAYNPNWDGRTTDSLCKTQAAFNMAGSIASFLWTLALALFMFVIIVMRKPGIAQKLVFVFYPVCWGVPIVLTVAFGIVGYLGFEESADVGWCYIRLIPVSPSMTNETSYTTSVFAQVLGYDVWVWIVFLVLPTLYIVIHCHLKFHVTRTSSCPTSITIHTRANTTDIKLIFVPVIFLLLRAWSAILDIPVFYLSDEERLDFRITKANAALVLLAGIGDSGQGLANAILFCVLTKQVRQRLLSTMTLSSCKNKWKSRFILVDPSTTPDLEESTQISGSGSQLSGSQRLSGSSQSRRLAARSVYTELPLDDRDDVQDAIRVQYGSLGDPQLWPNLSGIAPKH